MKRIYLLLLAAAALPVIVGVVILVATWALVDDAAPSDSGVVPDRQVSTNSRQATDCQFLPVIDDVPIYAVPLTADTQQMGVLPNGYTFPIVQQRDTHYEIVVNRSERGWVDRQTGILADETCGGVPYDETPLTAFDGICLFSTENELALHNDAELMNHVDFVPPGEGYIVAAQTGFSYQLQLPEGVSGWVDANEGATVGRCDGLPPGRVSSRVVTTLDGAALWSEPDVRFGDELRPLDSGMTLRVIGGPIPGPVNLETMEQADWYEVRIDRETTGWVQAVLVVSEPTS